MRRMKTLMMCFAFVGTMITASEAQEVIPADESVTYKVPEESKKEDPNTPFWKQEDPDYLITEKFRDNVLRNQFITGCALAPVGLSMVSVGIYKILQQTPAYQVGEIKFPASYNHRKVGIAMVATGTVSTAAGIILLIRGSDTIRELRNRKGQVAAKLCLPKTGDLGLSLRF